MGFFFLIAPFPDRCLLVPFYLFPLTKVHLHFRQVKMYDTLYPICWTISIILDLEPNYTDKLSEFIWVQIAPLSRAFLFLHCFERDFMDFLKYDNRAYVIRLPGTAVYTFSYSREPLGN